MLISVHCDNKPFQLSDSWVVLRSQEKEVLKVISKSSEKPAKGKWCDDEDDWGTPPR